MFNVRVKCFETNSSSTHSVSLSSTTIIDKSLNIYRNREITFEGGEFGWEWKRYDDALSKINYLSMFFENTEELKDIIKEVIGAEIIFKKEGYIDHVGDHRKKIKFLDREDLKNFIFNKRRFLFTGNDNTLPPNKFFDPPKTRYTYQLVLLNRLIRSWDFIRYPKNYEIKEAIQKITEEVLIDDYEFHDNFPIDYKNKRFFLVPCGLWYKAKLSFNDNDLVPWETKGYLMVDKKEKKLQQEGAIEISYKIQKWKRPG